MTRRQVMRFLSGGVVAGITLAVTQEEAEATYCGYCGTCWYAATPCLWMNGKRQQQRRRFRCFTGNACSGEECMAWWVDC